MQKIIYVDMDGGLCDFKGAHQKAQLEHPKIAYPQSQYGFFRNLEPIEGGVEIVKYVDTLDQFQNLQ